MTLQIGTDFVYVLRFTFRIILHFTQYILRHPTHDRRDIKTGFTLVEIMVATAVLSLGAMLIYEAFFISVSTFDYYSNYLSIAPKIDEKIWEAQSNLSRFGPAAYIQPEGNFTKGNKNFGWNMSYGLVESSETLELYKISFYLSWQEGEKTIRFSRDAYAIYRKEE